MATTILRILGKSGSGKTSFISGLIKHFSKLEISVIKHTRHRLSPPNPLKDTGHHFASGAKMSAGLSDQTGELFFQKPCLIIFKDMVDLFSEKSDVVLIEGARDQDLPTVLIGELPDDAKASNILLKLPARPALDEKLLCSMKELLNNEP